MRTHIDKAQKRAEMIGDRIAALAKRGVCSHGHIRTAPGMDFLDAPATCLGCGKAFATARAAMAESARICRGNRG